MDLTLQQKKWQEPYMGSISESVLIAEALNSCGPWFLTQNIEPYHGWGIPQKLLEISYYNWDNYGVDLSGPSAPFYAWLGPH